MYFELFSISILVVFVSLERNFFKSDHFFIIVAAAYAKTNAISRKWWPAATD